MNNAVKPGEHRLVVSAKRCYASASIRVPPSPCFSSFRCVVPSAKKRDKRLRSLMKRAHGSIRRQTTTCNGSKTWASQDPPKPAENSSAPRPRKKNAERIVFGKEVFIKHKCARCHKARRFTSPETYDDRLDRRDRQHALQSAEPARGPPAWPPAPRRTRGVASGLVRRPPAQFRPPLNAKERKGLLGYLRSL